MKAYHIRLSPGGGAGGAVLAVTVDETPEGLRVAIARGEAPAGMDPGAPGRRVDLAEIVPGWYSVLVDGRSHTLIVAGWRGGGRSRHLVFDGVAVTADAGRSRSRRVEAEAAVGAAAQVRAPMPGLVVAIQAGVGTEVDPGQPLIIMEAMKMQMEIRAPHAGVVRAVHVAPGQDVAGNDLLVTVE